MAFGIEIVVGLLSRLYNRMIPLPPNTPPPKKPRPKLEDLEPLAIPLLSTFHHQNRLIYKCLELIRFVYFGGSSLWRQTRYYLRCENGPFVAGRVPLWFLRHSFLPGKV